MGKVCALIFVVSLPAHLAIARSAANPSLLSAFPLGGTPGSTLRVAVLGENLQEAYGVWFDCPQLKGEVQQIEDTEIEAKDPKDGGKPKKGQSVLLYITIGATAGPGAHAFRLVTSNGVTGA